MDGLVNIVSSLNTLYLTWRFLWQLVSFTRLTCPEGRQDNRGQGHARGQDNVRTVLGVLGHVLTLSYVIKRNHDKRKREKMFNLDFAMADFVIILPILSWNRANWRRPWDRQRRPRHRRSLCVVSSDPPRSQFTFHTRAASRQCSPFSIARFVFERKSHLQKGIKPCPSLILALSEFVLSRSALRCSVSYKV